MRRRLLCRSKVTVVGFYSDSKGVLVGVVGRSSMSTALGGRVLGRIELVRGLSTCERCSVCSVRRLLRLVALRARAGRRTLSCIGRLVRREGSD